MIKTLIVDDDARFTRYISNFLATESEIEIVGKAADGEEAILKTRSLKPDLILMDIRMPGMNGLEATKLLKKEMPGLKVIILTVYDMDEYRQAAKAAGAVGYIVKKTINGDLIPVIKEIFQSKES